MHGKTRQRHLVQREDVTRTAYLAASGSGAEGSCRASVGEAMAEGEVTDFWEVKVASAEQLLCSAAMAVLLEDLRVADPASRGEATWF